MTRKLPIIAGLALLFAVLLCSWSWQRVRAQRTMHLADIPNEGLKLVGPDNPDFEGLATKLLDNRPDPMFEALKAYSVILLNQSHATVVAYYLRWTYTDRKGSRISVDMTDGRVSRLLDGKEVRTSEDERLSPVVPPGAWVIITPQRVLKVNSSKPEQASDPKYVSYISHLQRFANRFSKSSDIEVSIDGVFFEDGSFVGPNKSNFFETFKSEVDARQALAHYIVLSAGSGRSIDDLAREVEGSLPASPPRPNLLLGGSAGGLDEYFRYRYATEFLNVYRSLGDQLALGWAYENLFRVRPKLEKKSG